MRNRARYAAIRPTWGTGNRVLTPVAEPVELGLISHPEAAVQLEALAAWADEMLAGQLAPPVWVARQCAIACRVIASGIRQMEAS